MSETFTREIFMNDGTYAMCDVTVHGEWYRCLHPQKGWFLARPSLGTVCEVGIGNYMILDLLKEHEAKKEEKISRFEVIDHSDEHDPKGRIFYFSGEIEYSIQDEGRTLKVFCNKKSELSPTLKEELRLFLNGQKI